MSFMAPIFVGTLLLKMPNSTLFELSWIDALFMATSAVCVTGLVTVDLTQFTFLGQVIMALLIQIGGLGIMTLTLAFSSLIAGGLGVKERIMIGKMFSENKMSEVKGLLYKICVYTFMIELAGVGLLYFSLKHQMTEPSLKEFWVIIFHSISAFCNAGFSILEAGMANQLVQTNYFFCSVIMILIVLGGIGFPTLSNLQKLVVKSLSKDRDSHLLSTTTKVVLTATSALLILGTISLYLTESSIHLAGQSGFDRFFQSLFWSVTSRTAGFNTLPVEELSLMGALVLLLLMWIGGAPMSTAGGIKVTTVYLAFLNLKSQIFNLDRAEAFGRQIRSESVIRAFGVMTLSLVFIFISSFILVALEPALDTFDLLFEVVSAVSTVGLSRGITTDLGDVSKVVLIFLMFIGRVGLVTVFAAFVKPAVMARYRYLEDDIIV
jgi:Trk-type K+ transport system membrane component